MDLKSNHTPFLTDTAPVASSRLGVHSGLLPYSRTGAPFSHGMLLTIPRKKTGILEDVRSSGWLDAMKSSSPPPKKITKDVSHGFASSDADNAGAYFNWLLKYPSALTSFDQITNYAKGKRIVLFMDYDGTLSPIVDNPDCAFMSDNMRAAVKNVAEYFPTAIISGRSCDKVYEFVGLTELYYAGSHGMDIIGPVRQSVSDIHPNCIIRSTDKQGKEVNLFQPAAEFLQMINETSNFTNRSSLGPSPMVPLHCSQERSLVLGAFGEDENNGRMSIASITNDHGLGGNSPMLLQNDLPLVVSALKDSAEQNSARFYFPGHNRRHAAPASLTHLVETKPYVRDLREL